MALFTDAQTVTLNDLLPFEASLVQVASSHNIDVDQKIALAVASVGETLFLLLKDTAMSDPQWLSRRAIGLSTVVITPPLYHWLCFASLARFFAEAYNVQLNTRFDAKWKQYKEDARVAADIDVARRSWHCAQTVAETSLAGSFITGRDWACRISLCANHLAR